MRVVLLGRPAGGEAGRDESLGSMKQKYEGKDRQGLVDLGREQGYLTFDQVNGFLPQDVASPTDLRAALESFEDMDIKVLEEVPAEGAEGEIEAEPEKEPDEEATDTGDSSDPVRLYLKEMGNFQLLSREQEVEIAKRIEAGEQEVEEEVLKSPVTLDFLIDLGDRIEAGEADLRDIFEESEEPADPDEERGPEANEKLLKKLHDSTRRLKDLRSKLEELEEELRERPGPRRKPKLERRCARLRARVKAAFTTMGLSRHVREAVISEMRHQLDQFRQTHQIVQHSAQGGGRGRGSPLPRKPSQHFVVVIERLVGRRRLFKPRLDFVWGCVDGPRNRLHRKSWFPNLSGSALLAAIATAIAATTAAAAIATAEARFAGFGLVDLDISTLRYKVTLRLAHSAQKRGAA